MIDCYRFTVFDGSSTTPRLRWVDPAGVMAERVLDRGEIDRFVSDVEHRYRAVGTDLAGLGADLYRWLDGPTERWLAGARDRRRPMAVYLDCEERLRHLPWELLHDDGFLAVDAAQPLIPLRRASSRVADPLVVANRPLRVLFMASSPVDVAPVLDFEREEAMILAAATNLVELVVEESGSLSGLKSRFAMFGPDHFDVLHLSGHASIGRGPRFVLEDAVGRRADATAADIADAVGHSWPPLVFLSGCYTGGSASGGQVASMAEALIVAGAPAVLGWALPVGDRAATNLAGALYYALATGARRDWAAADARRALFTSGSPYWHLLRMYTDGSPLAPLVTAPATHRRAKLRTREVRELFLDLDGRVKVASSDGFVGRRRELQRCLTVMRPDNPAPRPQVLVVHGMGGLGKSTVAARLLDRMRSTHPHQAVWVGKIDEYEIAKLTDRITLDAARHLSVNQHLTQPALNLEERLRFVLDGPLADEGCVFVFDDFENGNLEPDGLGGHICTPAALNVVAGLARAIARTGSASRVLVTSRYDFPLPVGITAHRESLEAFRDADLAKKLQLTANLGPTSVLDPDVRTHAIAAAAGIPRLIERIDQLIGDPGTDHQQILDAITATAVDYREELLIETLLSAQSGETRRLLALAAIYQLPVPVEAVAALHPDGPVDTALARAVAVGLIDTGPHPTSGERRYLVSNLLKPLLDTIVEQLSDDDRLTTLRRGARALYERWVEASGE